MPKMTYNLALITDPNYPAPSIKAYLRQIDQRYEILDITHPGLRYLAKRMKQENKKPPALMYRNQIVVVTTRFRAAQALADWRLL